MNSKNKMVQTYLGFAVKSGAMILGQDAAVMSKKAKLILVAETLSENSLQKLILEAKRKGVEVAKIDSKTLQSVFGEKNVKVVAITDKNLANAIKNSTNQD